MMKERKKCLNSEGRKETQKHYRVEREACKKVYIKMWSKKKFLQSVLIAASTYGIKKKQRKKMFDRNEKEKMKLFKWSQMWSMLIFFFA